MTAVDTRPVAPAPGTPEWQRLVTASKVAAILGLSPWDSPRSVWHVLRGEVPADDGRNGDVKARGHYLEDGILRWWCDQHPEFGHVKRQFYRELGTWAAATPDGAAWRTRPARFAQVQPPEAVVDAKTARDDDEWGAPGTDEVPAYYAAQMQWQMHVTGARRGYIALLTTRLDFREYRLDYDPDTAAGLEQIAHDFWLSTQDPTAAPALDDHVATFDTLKRLHPLIQPDTSVEISETAAREFVEAQAAKKAAEAAERAAKSRLLEAMGSARLAKYGDVVVARRQGNKTGVSLVGVAKTLTEPKE
ncbi:YqaJ viral recombinase family protein [Xylanimonas oleitrophica]|uniref:YqaJ viral recombinase family protein n=1 Tax=Xylanimonas oleitrophica TaxID=2607479 RepID=UPI0015CFE46E|nr:YqaJ viral recombinase family protein [Xylanimonas oleitrophica]